MDDENKVEISAEELEQLQADSRKLAALEEAGVDNWEGYGYAMEILSGMEDWNRLPES